MHANYGVCCGLVWFTFLFGKGLRNGNPVLLHRAIAQLVETKGCLFKTRCLWSHCVVP